MSNDQDFKSINGPLAGVLKDLHDELARRGGTTEAAPKENRAICRTCGGRGFRIGRQGAIAVANACGCDLRCGVCDGRGFRVEIREGYQFHVRCECQSLGERIAAYNAAQLPARFSDKSFDEFYVHEGDPRELFIARRQMMDFADSARPGRTGLGKGLLGKPGCGKTHLLAATLSKMTLGRGLRCRYVEISFLFADMKAAISDPRARATVDKIDELAEVDILAIDELGKGRGSVFEEEVLDELIGRRYNNGKLTLFATNYPLQEPSARSEAKQDPWSQSLRSRVGERVFSRLHQMVEFLQLPPSTRDYRLPPTFT